MYEFVLINDWADTPKKLRSFKTRASPLSLGTWECVRLVTKNWDNDACNLRHRLVRFCFRTKTPFEIWDLYKSISMPYPTPLFTYFYLHRKLSIFIRNDCDCKDRSIQYKEEICSNQKFGSYEKHTLASKLFL